MEGKLSYMGPEYIKLNITFNRSAVFFYSKPPCILHLAHHLKKLINQVESRTYSQSSGKMITYIPLVTTMLIC